MLSKILPGENKMTNLFENENGEYPVLVNDEGPILSATFVS
jgi:hypothetical protein